MDKESTLDKQQSGKKATRIIEAKINLKNPASWDEYEKYSIDELIREGYDGAILDEDVFVFSPEQVLMSPADNADPRFSIKSPIGFYSTVENALDKIQQEKGTKEQFKKMLLNNGAKQAEMDWMGFDELPDKLTKADIQNWIDENRIEVKEIEKGRPIDLENAISERKQYENQMKHKYGDSQYLSK